MDIFQLDWILIDSVIILLLVFLLISVRVFKEFSRWRLSLSNRDIRVKSIPIEDLAINPSKKGLRLEQCKFISNRKNNDSGTPLIILLNSNFRTELLNVFGEGLASSGYNILQLKLKIRTSLRNIITSNNRLKKIGQNFYSYLTVILEFLRQKKRLDSSQYMIIKAGKSSLPYKTLLKDPNNKGIILINPSTQAVERDFSSFFHLIRQKRLLLIFTRIPYVIFKRRLLSQHLNAVSNRLSVIKDAFHSLKNYETILFGLILKFINRKTTAL